VTRASPNPGDTWRVVHGWGTADLLFAFYQGVFGVRLDPRALGAAFFIPTVVVPALLITHALIFWLLVRAKQSRNVETEDVHTAQPRARQDARRYRTSTWRESGSAPVRAHEVSGAVIAAGRTQRSNCLATTGSRRRAGTCCRVYNCCA
jgi:hypothetical protein